MIQSWLIESDIIIRLEELPQFELWVTSHYNIHRNNPFFILWLELRTLVAFSLHFQLLSLGVGIKPLLVYIILLGPVPYSCFILDFSIQKSHVPLFSVLALNHELSLELLLLKLKIIWIHIKKVMCAAWIAMALYN